MPWSDKNQLQDECHQSYEEKYLEGKDEIDESLRHQEPFVAIYYDELINFPDIDESDGQDESNNFNMVNLHLIDFNVVSNVDSKYAFVPLATVRCLSLPPEQFCSMCSQLNGAQKHFFSFIFKYIYIYIYIYIHTYINT